MAQAYLVSGTAESSSQKLEFATQRGDNGAADCLGAQRAVSYMTVANHGTTFTVRLPAATQLMWVPEGKGETNEIHYWK
jgi:hypothetical protein